MIFTKATRILISATLAMGGVSLAAAAVHSEEAFHIQAHRGGGIALPENTLETFRWSWERGVTPEADLRTTKDGVIVCYHDADLKRVVRHADNVKKDAAIENMSLVDVQKLDVGSFRGRQFSGQRVPTLASVFEEMRGQPDRWLYLDIKTADIDELPQLVREYGLEKQVIFTTPKHELIRNWKRRVPESKTLLWNGGSEAELKKKLGALRKAKFDGITHLQIHVRVGDFAGNEAFTPSREFLKAADGELERHGIVFQVLPWECSDQRAYEQLLALGVDSFATDYPEVTLRAVRAFRKQQPSEAAAR
jgi:glycerophosphoryl diester phosphodiesterase